MNYACDVHPPRLVPRRGALPLLPLLTFTDFSRVNLPFSLTRDIRPYVASRVCWGCLKVIGSDLYVFEHLIPLQPCSAARMNTRGECKSFSVFVREGARIQLWIPAIVFSSWILISQFLSVSAIWDGERSAANWLLDRVQLELKVCCVEGQRFSLRARVSYLITAPRCCVMFCGLLELAVLNFRQNVSVITGPTWFNWKPTKNSKSSDPFYIIRFSPPPFSIISYSLDSAYI